LSGGKAAALALAVVAAALLVGIAGANPDPTERVSVSSTEEQANGFSAAPAVDADGRTVVFDSAADNLVSDDANGLQDVFLRDRDAGTTVRVSVSNLGVDADGHSDTPDVSDSGARVVFQSTASDLILDDTNVTGDVFLREYEGTPSTVRVSVGDNEDEGDLHSDTPVISGNGKVVAFYSLATNLVAGDENGGTDLFVRDLDAGTTERINPDTAPFTRYTPAALSNDGRFVAFATDQPLVDQDTNGFSDIYLYDRELDSLQLISLGHDGESDGSSWAPAVSAEARYVAFDSEATNLAPGDGPATSDVFVHDRTTHTTARVSDADAGGFGPTLSGDGRFVTFEIPPIRDGFSEVYLRDRSSGNLERVSVDSGGVDTDNTSYSGEISYDGSTVAFASDATDIVAGDTNEATDIFARNLAEIHPLPPGIFVVNSIEDTTIGGCTFSHCTFREAIIAANAAAGPDTIEFDIFGASGAVQTITLGSALPTITDAVTIDGYTQPGASANTLAVGNDANILIQLKGGAAGVPDGLVVTSGGTTITGLVINNFPGDAIELRTNGNNLIVGNFLGTNAAGTGLPTNGGGIFIQHSPGNRIGGDAPAARNVINATANYAIYTPGACSGCPVDTGGANIIQGNYLGTDKHGTGTIAAPPNVRGGISLENANNVIGGTTAGARNVMSTVGVGGITLQEAGAHHNTIHGNYIGVDANGTAAIAPGWGQTGITVLRADDNTIGGPDTNARNVIATTTGISVFGVGGVADDNLVQNNYIGTNAAGSAALPASQNAGPAVVLDNAGGNTVADNVLANSSVAGVSILPGSANNVVRGNRMGTNAAGTAALPNNRGVSITSSSANTIGGTTAADRNVISGNTTNGVFISGSNATVQGNYIGVGSDGATLIGNQSSGVSISGNNNVIGGIGPGAGNVIAGNGPFFAVDGVDVLSGTGNAMRGNAIHSNANLGIDLGGNGPTANDTGSPDDADTGANNLQNFPVLTGATQHTGFLKVDFELHSTPSTSFDLDFYSQPSCGTGDDEAEVYLGSNSYTTDGDGDVSDSASLSDVVLTPGSGVSATATDPQGNTSEVSGCQVVAADAGQAGPTFTVNTPEDHLPNGCTEGDCTLREAILAANGAAGANEIHFAIDGDDHTIVPSPALPNITDPVVIDGTTEPDFSGTPIVELAGTSAGAGANGLTLAAGSGGSTIRGLVINRFSGSGLVVTGSTGHVIEGNRIGTDPAGTLDLGNGDDGIRVVGGTGSVIGGTTAAARNVIAGNGRHGVVIQGGSGSTVRGNYVGVDATGDSGLGNVNEGVLVNVSSDNVVLDNVVSGNGSGGVHVSGHTGNEIRGNLIGTNASGTAAIPNDSGVVVDGANNNSAGTVVGGTAPADRNVISGNQFDGVLVIGEQTGGLAIRGNYIGTAVDGATPLGNGGDGVELFLNPVGITVGGATSAAGNVISANAGNGIRIEGATASDNVIQNNAVGTNAAGSSALGNGTNGVLLINSPGTQVGSAGAGNLISGNAGDGIEITGAAATGNVVASNLIGTNSAGTGAVPNVAGVAVTGAAHGNTIGGAVSAARNVISGNTEKGVHISASGGEAGGQLVNGNLIGVGADGTTPLGNEIGIHIDGSPANDIGDPSAIARNVIGFNDFGIVVSGGASVSNQIAGNFVGVSAPDGADEMGNLGPGILIDAPAGSNLIGGSSQADRNMISANGGPGLLITASGNAVQNNLIGTNALNQAVGNATAGVAISGSSNLIGGFSSFSGNRIAFNSGDGIEVMAPGTDNEIQSNSIFSNGSTGNDLGIDLDGDGVTANDADDTDGGANGRQNFPTLTQATAESSGVRIIGSLSSTPHTPFRLDFYASEACDGSGNGEGKRWLGWSQPSTDADGTLEFDTGDALSASVTPGEAVTATATNPSGNTSEFSACEPVAAGDTDQPGPTFTVNTAADTAPDGCTTASCTLREAITAANGADGANEIHFNIACDPQIEICGESWHATIQPATPLPVITQAVSIDATTQPGYDGAPLIELDGSSAPLATHGLEIATGDSLVRGFAINRFNLAGIRISAGSGNSILANYLGTDAAGTIDLGNHTGVQVLSANNIIGGPGAASRNVISGNETGLFLDGAAGTLVQGNYIGTDASGEAALGNGSTGVAVSGGNGVVIGGTTPGVRNVISGNLGYGVYLTGGVPTVQNTRLEGNYIGVDVQGDDSLPNGTGVRIFEGHHHTIGGTIGGDFAAARNIISGNVGHGIEVISPNSSFNRIFGNYIGTDVSGTEQLGNGGSGVRMAGAGLTFVGYFFPGTGNVISGNQGHGVFVDGDGAGANGVHGNLIGTTADGTGDLGNVGDGIRVEVSTTFVGGTAVEARNVVSGNNGNGVVLDNTGSSRVEGNYIGTDITGTVAIANGLDGIAAANSGSNTIGGTATGAGNLISGNTNRGISVSGGSNQIAIQGNRIGTKADGASPLGNGSEGIRIDDAGLTTVGGTDSAAANRIAFNGGDGVAVTGNIDGQLIHTNSIVSNGGTEGDLGIDLGGDGVTANDTGDADIGPNDFQNFPVLTSVTDESFGVRVRGSLQSTPNTSFRLDFYVNDACDDSGNGEGDAWIGWAEQSTNGSGTLNIDTGEGLTASVSPGDVVTATATGPAGTSEFSACRQVAADTVDLTVESVAFTAPANFPPHSYTATVKNLGTGTADVANVVVQGYYSSDDTIDEGDSPACGVVMGGTLAPGASRDVPVGCSGAPGANHTFLLVRVDDGNTLAESDEANNVGSAELTQSGPIFTVNSAGDGAPNGCTRASCTLREAILAANAFGGPALPRIEFNLSGATIISPTTSLPAIERNWTTVDGATQPGYAGAPLVRIDGALLPPGDAGLQVSASSATVSALSITNVNGNGITLSGGSNTVEKSFIGTDAGGELAGGNSTGIYVDGANNIVGGASGNGNVIVGGVWGVVAAGNNTLIQSNHIGVTQTAHLGNNLDGIFVSGGATGATIGGAATGNIIAGNGRDGIRIVGPTTGGVTVHGNTIGGPAEGSTTQPGNGGYGVAIIDSSGNKVGGTADGEGNAIRHNGNDGISVTSPEASATGNTILRNSIHANAGLGIDLGDDDVTVNDAGDTDPGANNLQNFPELSSATASDGQTRVEGVMRGGPSLLNMVLEFFSSPTCDPLNHGEGQTYLGSITIPDQSGSDQPFTFTHSAALPTGHVVTATATSESGDTSEFSACTEVTEPVGGATGANLDLDPLAPTAPAGAEVVPLGNIPPSAIRSVSAGVATQNVELDSIPLEEIPLEEIPLEEIPLEEIGFTASLLQTALGGVHLSDVPLSIAGGWDAVLTGTRLAGVPHNTITLADVYALSPLPERLSPSPNSNVEPLTLGQIDLSATPLEEIALGAIALGATPLEEIPLEEISANGPSPEEQNRQAWCDAINAIEGFECSSADSLTGETLVGLAVRGTPLEEIPLEEIPLEEIELAGTPLEEIPLEEIDMTDTPLEEIPLEEIPLEEIHLVRSPLEEIPLEEIGPGVVDCSGGYCDAAANHDLGDAATANRILPNVTLGQLVNALTDGSSASLADLDPGLPNVQPGDRPVTLREILSLLLGRAAYDWETLPLTGAFFPQDYASVGGVITYQASFTVNGTGSGSDVTLEATVPDDARYVPDSSRLLLGASSLELEEPSQAFHTPESGPRTLRLTWNANVTFGADYLLEFKVRPSLSLGSSTASMTLSTAGIDDEVAAAPPVQIGQTLEAGEGDPQVAPDALYFGHLTRGDSDFVRVPIPPEYGSRTTIDLSHLPADYDLVVFGPPLPAPAPAGSEGVPLGNEPLADTKVPLGQHTQPLPPETLQDVAVDAVEAGTILRASSDNRGTADEHLELISLGETGEYTIRIDAYEEAESDQPYVLRVSQSGPPNLPDCAPRDFGDHEGEGQVGPAPAIPPGVNTLFVVNQKRLGDTHGAQAAGNVMSKLGLLASRPEFGVTSAVVSVESDAAVAAAYSAWDANPCSPAAANGVANEITKLLDRLITPGMEEQVSNIVIVGGDDIVPFGRLPDETEIANERTYASALGATNNQFLGSFGHGFLMTDDLYGDRDPKDWFGRKLYVPERAVGRLVEEPAQIMAQVDQFIERSGRITPTTKLVTGYDFLIDGAEGVDGALTGLTGTPMISDVWSRQDLISALFPASGTPPQVNSVNAHFDHRRALPADQDAARLQDELFTTEDIPAGSLDGRLLFTMGCHSGFAAANAVFGLSALSSDFAETVAANGGVGYIGNTGYGLGDTAIVAYSERLHQLFAAGLRGRTIGAALVAAKQQYIGIAAGTVITLYDEKVSVEATHYGLPMYRYGPDVPPAEKPDPLPTTTDSATGLQSAAFHEEPEIDVDNPVTTPNGQYFRVAGEPLGGVEVTPRRPIQPLTVIDVTQPPSVGLAHGAILEHLESAPDLTGFDAAWSRVEIDSADAAPELVGEGTSSSKLQAITTVDIPGGSLHQQLLLLAGQYRSDGDPDPQGIGVQTIYTEQSGKVYFSSSPDYVPPQFGPVDIVRVDSASAATIGFAVDVTDLDHNGNPGTVKRVMALYRDCNNVWRKSEFSKAAASNRWSGGGPVTAGCEAVSYFIQAVDAAGNVGVTSRKVLQAPIVVDEPDDPGEPDTITATLTGTQHSSGWFTSDVSVKLESSNPSVTIKYSVDGEAFKTYSGAFTITANGVHMIDFEGSDGSDGTEVAAIDKSGPTILITTPKDGGKYVLNSPVLADYTCADAGSGAQSCVGTKPAREPIDTSAVGTKHFSVTATDAVGNSATKQVSYEVIRRPILFASSRTGSGDIYAVDPHAATPTPPIQVTEGNAIDAEPEWFPDGDKLVFTSSRSGNGDIYSIEFDGDSLDQLTSDPAIDTSAAVSPDGTKIAFASNRGGNWNIWVMNTDGSNPVQLTEHGASDLLPAWNSDGTQIAFMSTRSGNGDIYKMNADGNGETRLTMGSTANGVDTEPAWYGSTIAFATNRHGNSNFEIYTLDLSNPSNVVQTRRTSQAGHDITPAWSVDGSKIAFASNRSPGGGLNFNIWTADANFNAASQKPLVTHGAADVFPDW
jgi:CSLREA domain-containing protein